MHGASSEVCCTTSSPRMAHQRSIPTRHGGFEFCVAFTDPYCRSAAAQLYKMQFSSRRAGGGYLRCETAMTVAVPPSARFCGQG